MFKNLFRTKCITALRAEATDKEHALNRTLGPFSLVSIGIGCIVGAGFFVFTGLAAAEHSGPAVPISFAIAALICLFAAFCYAEFASLIPISGSAYSYAYSTMGEIVAWTIGWGTAIYYILSASAVAVGWSGYLQSLLLEFGIILPKQLAGSPLGYHPITGWYVTGNIINLPAVLIVLLIGHMIAIGVKTASILNNIMVVIKLVIILLFAVCAISFISWDNLVPFIPENTGVFGQFGWSGVFKGSGILFFAFIGFETVSTMAQEAKDPQKNMPIGMLGSLGISTLIYMIVSILLVGVVGYIGLNVADPFGLAVKLLGPNFAWLSYVFKIGVVLSLSSVVLVMMMAQSRVFYSMSMDGLLPPIFCKVHKKYKTPFFTSIVVSIFVLCMAGTFPVEILGEVTSMAALLVFALVSLGVLILRYKKPDLKRPFKTPFMPLVPILSILTCFGQMLVFGSGVWLQLGIWLLFGYMIYFSYSNKNSLLAKGM